MSRFACSPGGEVEADRRKLQRGLGLLTLVVVTVAAVLVVQGVYGSAVLLTLVALLTIYAARMARDLDLMWIDLNDDSLALQLRRRRLLRPVPITARQLTEEETQHLRQLTRWSGFQVATGGYDSHLLGEIEAYTSNLERPVLLQLPEEALVVTPDEPEGLVAAVQGGGGVDLWPG